MCISSNVKSNIAQIRCMINKWNTNVPKSFSHLALSLHIRSMDLVYTESRKHSTVGESMAGQVQTVFRWPETADGDWGPFSSSGMNRGEVCLQANTEDVMSLPHCRTISGSHYWSPVRKLLSNLKEASRGEHCMFYPEDKETHMYAQWRQLQQ